MYGFQEPLRTHDSSSVELLQGYVAETEETTDETNRTFSANYRNVEVKGSDWHFQIDLFLDHKVINLYDALCFIIVN